MNCLVKDLVLLVKVWVLLGYCLSKRMGTICLMKRMGTIDIFVKSFSAVWLNVWVLVG